MKSKVLFEELKNLTFEFSGRSINQEFNSEQIWSLFSKEVDQTINLLKSSTSDIIVENKAENENSDEYENNNEVNEDETDLENFEKEELSDQDISEKDSSNNEIEKGSNEDIYGESNEEEGEEAEEEDLEFDTFMNQVNDHEFSKPNNQDFEDLDEKEIEEEEEVVSKNKSKSKKKINKELEEASDSEDAEEVFETLAYGVSSKNISRIENKLVTKKEWQLRGEVRGMDRPVNALLDVDVDFETGLHSKIVITPEVNQSLEELIKRRIGDLAYDDRKKSSSNLFLKKDKKLPDLDFEKDRRGLIAVYEDKYKETNSVGAAQTKDQKVKDEIKDLFRKIAITLDSMSCGFGKITPIPLLSNNPEKKLIVEEKVPVAISSLILNDRKTYKETHNPKEKELKSKVEMSTAEKKRLARKIKISKKRVSKIRKERDQVKSGLSTADNKMLERNKSTMNKQIKDSKVQRVGFDKTSNFFEKLSSLKSK